MPEHHAVPPAFNQMRAIKKIMQNAGQSVDQMNATQTSVYLAMTLDMLANLLVTIGEGAVTSIDPRADLFQTTVWLQRLSDALKQDKHHGDIIRAPREKMLGYMTHTMIASASVALSYSTDAEGAFREMNDASINYRSTDLAPFVRARELDE